MADFPSFRVNRFSKVRSSSFLRDHIFLQRDFRLLRNACSNFCSKPTVRQFIFDRDGNRCVECGCQENLTIDHVISVGDYAHFITEGCATVWEVNTQENLQTLCKTCNFKKRHMDGLERIAFISARSAKTRKHEE